MGKKEQKEDLIAALAKWLFGIFHDANKNVSATIREAKHASAWLNHVATATNYFQGPPKENARTNGGPLDIIINVGSKEDEKKWQDVRYAVAKEIFERRKSKSLPLFNWGLIETQPEYKAGMAHRYQIGPRGHVKQKQKEKQKEQPKEQKKKESRSPQKAQQEDVNLPGANVLANLNKADAAADQTDAEIFAALDAVLLEDKREQELSKPKETPPKQTIFGERKASILGRHGSTVAERQEEKKQAPRSKSNVHRLSRRQIRKLEPYEELTRISPSRENDQEEKDEQWLLAEIQKESFLKEAVKNLEALRTWKEVQYKDLMIRKAGNKETKDKIIQKYLANEKKKGKENDSTTSAYNATETYVIELYKHSELVKEQKITAQKLKKQLMDAIQNPKFGIVSLTGDSRKSLRLDLVRTIYSLSSSVAAWKLGKNMIIVGESGAGKTKAANVIGHVYSQMGVLATNRFSDVTTTSLISDHVGGTAKLTEGKLLDSLESTILIDEIYRTNSKCDKPSELLQKEMDGKIAPPQNETTSPFGIEAITQMVAMLAELRGLIVVIVAGYAPNIKCWLTSNDGLERRFIQTIDLPLYSAEDFTNMFMRQFQSILHDDGRRLNDENTDTVRQYVHDLFQDMIHNDPKILKRQAGDIDIIANYFATSLGQMALLDLVFPNDILYVVLLAFHRFLQRSKARWEWEVPEKLGRRRKKQRKAGGGGKSEKPIVSFPRLYIRI